MKYITKPARLPIGPDGFGVDDFAKFLVATCKQFNESGAGIRAGIRIEDACARDAEKGYVELQPEHHALLAQAAEHPSGGYPVLRGEQNGKPFEQSIARDCLAFVDAIAEAKDAPPSVVAVPDAKPEPQAAE